MGQVMALQQSCITLCGIFEVVFHLVSFEILGHLHFWGWANYPLLVPLSCPYFVLRPICLGLTYQLRERGQDSLRLNHKNWSHTFCR